MRAVTEYEVQKHVATFNLKAFIGDSLEQLRTVSLDCENFKQ